MSAHGPISELVGIEGSELTPVSLPTSAVPFGSDLLLLAGMRRRNEIGIRARLLARAIRFLTKAANTAAVSVDLAFTV